MHQISDARYKHKGGEKMVCCQVSYGHQSRSFLTKEEKIQMLKDYKESLDRESKGVSEKIAHLENEI